MPKKIAVAMSGGVDSSLAAALLKEEGYEVIGVTMQIWPEGGESDSNRDCRCCSLSAVEDARRVANRLGIPYYVLNLKGVFQEKVIDNFISEYRAGRTPNPCVRCNRYVKFEALLNKVQGLDVSHVATGHYAQIEHDPKTQKYILKKGCDPKKDQSYFLYTMTQAQLAHTLMPLGDLTKSEARKLAVSLSLPVAAKPESQEICFIADNNYARFLKECVPEAVQPGPILDKHGNILGVHGGIVFYTVGQRRGLRIAKGKPLYIMSIDREKNAVVVGEWGDTLKEGLIAEEVSYVSGEPPQAEIEIKAKVRYADPEAEAVLTPLDKKRAYLKFKEPQRAIAPGQAVVFYRGDVVVGVGTIL